MRFVLQRVKHASVKVDGELIGSIGRGYMVLMGVSDTDTEEITDKMVDKMCKLRIFEDENGKTNCSLADVDGEILLISQFTLYADCSHGNRPGLRVREIQNWRTISTNTRWRAAPDRCGRSSTVFSGQI